MFFVVGSDPLLTTAFYLDGVALEDYGAALREPIAPPTPFPRALATALGCFRRL